MLSNIKKKCLAWSNASSVRSWQTESAEPNHWNSCRCGQLLSPCQHSLVTITGTTQRGSIQQYRECNKVTYTPETDSHLYILVHTASFFIQIYNSFKAKTFFLLPVIIQPLLLLHQYCSIAISNILKIFCAFVHFIKNFLFSMIDHLYCTHACIYIYKKLQVTIDMLWIWNVDNHRELSILIFSQLLK